MIHQGTIGIPQKGGKYKVAHYWVMVYDERSDRGINGGKISKLGIKIDGVLVASYDRGWDIRPDEKNEAVQITYCILLQNYN